MSIEVGQKAPAFSLPATTGEEISLEDYVGERPFLLLFFPLAYTSVCTNELKIMRDELDYYRSNGVDVLAASVDSPLTLKEWAEKLELGYPLLSDFNREAAPEYCGFYDDFGGLKGVARRSTFLIDDDGFVRYRWVSDDPGVLPDFEAIKQAVEEVVGNR